MVTEEEIKKLVVARLSSMPESMKVSIGSYGSFDKYALHDLSLLSELSFNPLLKDLM